MSLSSSDGSFDLLGFDRFKGSPGSVVLDKVAGAGADLVASDGGLGCSARTCTKFDDSSSSEGVTIGLDLRTGTERLFRIDFRRLRAGILATSSKSRASSSTRGFDEASESSFSEAPALDDVGETTADKLKRGLIVVLELSFIEGVFVASPSSRRAGAPTVCRRRRGAAVLDK